MSSSYARDERDEEEEENEEEEESTPGPQGEPFVYWRTSLRPRIVRFADCCL